MRSAHISLAAKYILMTLLTLACDGSSRPSEPGPPYVPSAPAAPDAPPTPAVPPAPSGFASDDQIALDGIRLMNLDGLGTTRITNVGWKPSWSPDGRRLVYTDTECDTDWQTYLVCERGGLKIVNPETLEGTTLFDAATGDDPAWSQWWLDCIRP
jgi:hypothetical protein